MLSIYLTLSAQQNSGVIEGRVYNSKTNESVADPLKYSLKYITNVSGTVLPTIGIIMEF